MELKVISYNIWFGIHIKEVIKFIRRERPDIVCLQEVTRFYHNYGLEQRDLVAELRWSLPEYNLIFAPVLSRSALFRREEVGNAVLCKGKLDHYKVHYLFHSSAPVNQSGQKPTNLLEASVRIGKEAVTVYTTHLTFSAYDKPDSSQKIDEANRIAALVRKRRSILCGDFNASPASQVLSILEQILPNRELSDEPTVAANRHLNFDGYHLDTLKIKVDHLLTSEDITIVESASPPLPYSNHLPIIVRIKL